jgi:hypothetical protein
MNEDEADSAEAYAFLRGIDLGRPLGCGLNGKVWRVTGKSNTIEWALKIQDARGFRQEWAVYERLRDREVTEVAGFNVPQFLTADERWRAIEMSIVDRPFVLDFAQAYLDEPPDFPPEVWEERRETWMERYGEDWPAVQSALDALECMGIHYMDVHRGNIAM